MLSEADASNVWCFAMDYGAERPVSKPLRSFNPAGCCFLGRWSACSRSVDLEFEARSRKRNRASCDNIDRIAERKHCECILGHMKGSQGARDLSASETHQRHRHGVTRPIDHLREMRAAMFEYDRYRLLQRLTTCASYSIGHAAPVASI